MEPARFEGTLAKWNEERGFGFIAPAQGGQEIFIHVSAFPRDGRKPRLNESLSFAVELNRDGKKRATGVRRPMLPGDAGSSRHKADRSFTVPAPARMSRKPKAGGSRIMMLMALLALGAYGYSHYERRTRALTAPTSGAPKEQRLAEQPLPPLNARCDGRTYCSQMTSCAEATFFLQHCPGTQMDGNNDGIPCEQQWCSSPFAR